MFPFMSYTLTFLSWVTLSCMQTLLISETHCFLFVKKGDLLLLSAPFTHCNAEFPSLHSPLAPFPVHHGIPQNGDHTFLFGVPGSLVRLWL